MWNPFASGAHEVLIAKGGQVVVPSYPPTWTPADTWSGNVLVRIGTPSSALTPEASPIVAAKESLNLATNAAAPRGARVLTVASGADFKRGRKYLVKASSSSVKNDIVVESADDSASVGLFLTEPIPLDIPNGSTIRGVAALATVTTAMTADVGPGVILWEITEAGGVIKTKWRTDIRIVAALNWPQWSASDVTQLSPYCARMQPPDDQTFARTLRAAMDRYVRPGLLAKGIQPERVSSWESLTAWLIAACELFLAESFDDNPDAIKQKTENLVATSQQALSSMRFWVDDAAGSGQAVQEEPRPGAGSYSWVSR